MHFFLNGLKSFAQGSPFGKAMHGNSSSPSVKLHSETDACQGALPLLYAMRLRQWTS